MASSIPEIYKGFQYFKVYRDPIRAPFGVNFSYTARTDTDNLCTKFEMHSSLYSKRYRGIPIFKISPVGDWRSTSLEWPWPWPWFRRYGIPSCITHRPLPTYQISLRSKENFFWKSPLRFWSSLESRDTKTRTNIKNPARSNLDIVL